MATIALPSTDGSVQRHPFGLPVRVIPASSRIAYAAAHVVADPLRAAADGGTDQIDWDATLRLRRRLWDLGLGVAEAMDTSQRGMGLDWPDARELAHRSIAEGRERCASPWVGLAVDSYHVWWDVALPELQARTAPSLHSAQLADWLLPIHGQLSSRGMHGDGHIDMSGFVELVRSVGYRGLIEVEVLSDHWWATPPADVVRAAAAALRRIPEPAPIPN